MHHYTHAVRRHLQRIEELARTQSRHIAEAFHSLERIMAKTAQDLTDDIAALGTTIAAHEQARDATDAALQQTITNLQATIDAGSVPTDFQAFVDQLEGIRQNISNPPAAAPATPPVSDETGG